MTIATHNACHICVAMHTARLTALEAGPELITALRTAQPLTDERLEALRTFTPAAMRSAGAVEPAELEAFLARGFTPRNALEVVLGIGTYTLSTLANRLTQAPRDEPLQAFARAEQPS